MTWFIGEPKPFRIPTPRSARRYERLRGLAELDDPESLVVPILIDAILMAESYRGARAPGQLPARSLRGTSTHCLRELTIVDKAKEWASGLNELRTPDAYQS